MVVWDVTPSDAKARSQTPFFEEKSEELSNKKISHFSKDFGISEWKTVVTIRRRPICGINAEDNSLEDGLKTPPARGHSEKDPAHARLVVCGYKGSFLASSPRVRKGKISQSFCSCVGR